MKKILLVDDDPFVLDIYSSQLKKEGFNVDVSNSANKALEKLSNQYPDLLIVDLNLDSKSPGPQEGINMIKTIRQNDTTKDLKIIVISNYSEKEYPEISNINKLGVDKIFLKVQITPEEVVKSVKEILK